MTAVFLKLAEQLNSSVFVLLGILAAAFWALFRIGSWSQKFLHHDEKMKDLSGMRDSVIKLEAKVDLIYKNTLPNPLVRAQSPISLTAVGKEIAEKLQAEKILQRCIAALVADVESRNPKNAYDIQIESMATAKNKMMALLNEDELGAVKSEAYSRGMLAEDILDVFGVLLRNRILEQRGIPVSDVDKHEKKPA